MRLRALIAAAFVCFSVGILSAQGTQADSETKAVRKANDMFYAALNAMFKGNAAPMTKVWSHANDVTYLGPDRSFRIGWKATLKDWEKQASMKLGGKIEPKDVHITVGQSLAVVHNYEVGDNVVAGKSTNVKIRATNVYRKENGIWKMIGHHTDLLPFLDK